jgi:hypothetical protein
MEGRHAILFGGELILSPATGRVLFYRLNAKTATSRGGRPVVVDAGGLKHQPPQVFHRLGKPIASLGVFYFVVARLAPHEDWFVIVQIIRDHI